MKDRYSDITGIVLSETIDSMWEVYWFEPSGEMKLGRNPYISWRPDETFEVISESR